MSASCGCCTVKRGGGGGCHDIELQAASEHTASSSEQTARHHGNAAPLDRSLSMVLKASRRPGRKEAKGEGCCECCRQRKAAVDTCPDSVNTAYFVHFTVTSLPWFIYKKDSVMKVSYI